MIHFSLILYHNMGIMCAENMGMSFDQSCPSFYMGTFSDPQQTHPGISYWSRPPPAPGGAHASNNMLMKNMTYIIHNEGEDVAPAVYTI